MYETKISNTKKLYLHVQLQPYLLCIKALYVQLRQRSTHPILAAGPQAGSCQVIKHLQIPQAFACFSPSISMELVARTVD